MSGFIELEEEGGQRTLIVDESKIKITKCGWVFLGFYSCLMLSISIYFLVSSLLPIKPAEYGEVILRIDDHEYLKSVFIVKYRYSYDAPMPNQSEIADRMRSYLGEYRMKGAEYAVDMFGAYLLSHENIHEVSCFIQMTNSAEMPYAKYETVSFTHGNSISSVDNYK